MRALIGVIAPTTTRLYLRFGGFNGSSLLEVQFGAWIGTYMTWTTNSTEFVELASASYTIDKDRPVSVLNIYFDIFHFANIFPGICKLQISGDGGTTWVDATDEVSSGGRTGPGLWITTINKGENQFKIRLVGKSSTGALGTIKLHMASFIDITLNYQ